MKKEHEPYFYIIGLAVLTYIWTIFFGFTYYDDSSLILNNLKFLENLGNIPQAFRTDVFQALAPSAYYRPLLTVSFIFDTIFSKGDPLFYHLMNIVFHIIASCLVFIFLRRLKFTKDLSLLFSVIFAVHPVLSQAVAWIPGRNDSLLTIFTLLSFIFFINFLKSGKVIEIVWHFVFLAAALFTKETAIFIPPIIVLYVLLFRKKYLTRNKIFIIFPWVIIFLTWFLLRHFALINPVNYGFNESIKSLYIGLPAAILYLGKVFFPVNLSVLPILKDSTLIFGFMSVLLILVGLYFSKNKNHKILLFGIIWFLFFLLPTFINPDPNAVADFLEQRLYLPIIGLFIVLGQIEFINKVNFLSKNTVKFTALIIAILIFINIIHTSIFRDRLTFWQSAVASSYHDPLAHKNLGAMYYLDGDLTKAENEDKIALRLNKYEVMVHNNLGIIYMNTGKLKMAEEEYQKEIQINPAYANVYYNYGLLLYKEGNTKEGDAMFKKVYQLDPNY